MLAVWAVRGIAAPLSQQDVQVALNFWNTPGRYETRPAAKDAPYRVRQTPEGSLWLWAYSQKRSFGKAQATTLDTTDASDWDAWIDAKIVFDRWQAALAAEQLNARQGYTFEVAAQPADPGSIPDSLRLLVGDAPLFAVAAEPKLHKINFGAGDTVELEDYPDLQPKFLKFRFSLGVRHFGTPLKKLDPSQLSGLFSSAGITDSEQRIFKAVSLLEGGFDSVNTYDTGYVSVGFIQFACLGKGSGSLGQVLRREKAESPADFKSDFQQYGLDVLPDGQLVALDLDHRQVKTGTDAAFQIIGDPRLAAVFRRAGMKSASFRTAQLKSAKDLYFPLNDPVKVVLNGQTVTCKVGDFVKSEAGLATLMDRKVKQGNIAALSTIAAKVAADHNCRTAADLASYERDIVKAMTLRKDYLSDDSLSQPASRSLRSKVQRASKGSRVARRKS